MISHAILVVPRGRKYPSEDAVEVIAGREGATLVSLADGIPFCGAAASAFVRRLSVADPDALAASVSAALEEFMAGEIAVLDEGDGGEAAALLALVTRDGIVTGVSAGDCEAWILGPGDRAVPLTAGQKRKPRVGAGCVPVAFGPTHLEGGVLLLGSDGLFGWLSGHRIPGIAAASTPEELPRALHEAALAANGGRLGDDFTCVSLWMGALGSEHAESPD